MDTSGVYNIFRKTYDADPQIRKSAEAEIKALEDSPSLLLQLFTILGHKEGEAPVKQAVCIYFKNKVRNSWQPSQNNLTTPIADADRQFIREHILPLMVEVDPSVRVQLVSCLGPMLNVDFPQSWPTYMPQTREFLQTNDPARVYAGLSALYAVVRLYQWKVDKDARAPLEEIITACFPLLQTIGNTLVEQQDDLAATMLKIVLRCYHGAIQTDLSPSLQISESLTAWGDLFLRVIRKPEVKSPMGDANEASQDSWWKARKWAMRCLNRLFSRYGNPALLPSSQRSYLGFANNFVEKFAPSIVQCYFEQVDHYANRRLCFSPKCLSLVGSFFSDAIKHRLTWKLVKPHTEALVKHFIYPQLMYTADDEELWQDNPADFVHKKLDPLEDFESPVTAANNLLVDLATDRRKHSFMLILSFINKVVLSYADEDPVTRDDRCKDAALAMLGGLARIVLHPKSPVRGNMEAFLVQHVFPEFRSPNPFLRLRALMVYLDFSDLELRNSKLLPEITHEVLLLLQDPQVPVRVQAAMSLQPLVREEVTRNIMSPGLPQIMNQFLNLTNELDIDILSSVMEEFVETFSEQMGPYASQLCGQLSQTYFNIMREAVNADGRAPAEQVDFDSMGDKIYAAMGVLRTIATLVTNLEITPQTIQELEAHLIPLAAFTLQHELIDLYDDTFEIIDCCTFAAKQISPAMWTLLPLLHRTFENTGADYFDVMLPSLDNFVTYGAQEVSNSDELKNCMMHFVRKVLQSDRYGENDRVFGCKLAESLLLNCRGNVDPLVPEFIGLAFQYLGSNEAIKTRSFRVYCLELVLNCFYYNPSLTFTTLENAGFTQAYFTQLTQALAKFHRVHDKKLLIMALCAIFQLPPNQIPHSVQSGLGQLFEAMLAMFETLPKAQENRQRLEKMYDGISSDGDDDDEEDDLTDSILDEDFEGEDDEEDVGDEDREYLDMLSREASKLHKSVNASSGDDQSDDDDDEYLDEEVLFESPLDKIDVYDQFRSMFSQLRESQSPVLQTATNGMTPEKEQFVNTVLNHISSA
ncbi:Nonsense-mediated mRNA decay protein 5 [Dispira simplex]|nr:Nonsense-mediated mRNA decay protein 5 [Dispira simplex]